MAEPFLGEIKMVGFNFPMRDWAQCDGQSLPINQNSALFSLLGTGYGGNGTSTFNLPDYRGRVPIHIGSGGGAYYQRGNSGGLENVTLTSNEMPSHSHDLMVDSNTATKAHVGISSNMVFAESSGQDVYRAAASNSAVNLNAASMTAFGGDQSHANMQPFQVVNFIIALQGTYPSRN